MKGPWGPKTLCVVHYVNWFRKKCLDLSDYVIFLNFGGKFDVQPELPTKPINIEANTEPKYTYFLQTKKQKEMQFNLQRVCSFHNLLYKVSFFIENLL